MRPGGLVRRWLGPGRSSGIKRSTSAGLRELCTQTIDLIFKGANALEEVGLLELFESPARGDVLRTVPIECGEVDPDGALGTGFQLDRKLVLPLARFAPGDDLDVGEDFQAGLIRVVHEEEGGAVVGTKVAGGDVLAVADDVGVGEGAVVEDLEEAGGAPAELDVGPAGLADGGDVEAVAGGDELFFEFAEGVVGRAAFGELFIGGGAAHLALDSFDVVGEGEGGELMGHEVALISVRWTRAHR